MKGRRRVREGSEGGGRREGKKKGGGPMNVTDGGIWEGNLKDDKKDR